LEWPVIKVISPTKEFLGEIDLYTSLRFKRSWQGVGDFEIHIIPQQFNKVLFAPDNLIMLGEDVHRVGIIRTVTSNLGNTGFEVVIQGQHLDGLTSQRLVVPYEGAANGGYFCVPKKSTVNSTVNPVPAETILKTFVSGQIPYGIGNGASNPRNMMLTVVPDEERGMNTVWMSRYDQLDEALQSICEYTDMGYEIYLLPSQARTDVYSFDVIPGVDRSEKQTRNSRVIISLEFESVESISYSNDTAAYKNVAYAAGAGENYNRSVLTVTNETETPKGYRRRETFVDCGTLEIAETETTLSLAEEGKHKLQDYKKVESLTAEVSQSSPFIYREHYDLGDLVTVYVPELGLAQDMRVAEAEESYDQGRISLNITFGTAPSHIGRTIRAIQPQTR